MSLFCLMTHGVEERSGVNKGSQFHLQFSTLIWLSLLQDFLNEDSHFLYEHLNLRHKGERVNEDWWGAKVRQRMRKKINKQTNKETSWDGPSCSVSALQDSHIITPKHLAIGIPLQINSGLFSLFHRTSPSPLFPSPIPLLFFFLRSIIVFSHFVALRPWLLYPSPTPLSLESPTPTKSPQLNLALHPFFYACSLFPASSSASLPPSIHQSILSPTPIPHSLHLTLTPPPSSPPSPSLSLCVYISHSRFLPLSLSTSLYLLNEVMSLDMCFFQRDELTAKGLLGGVHSLKAAIAWTRREKKGPEGEGQWKNRTEEMGKVGAEGNNFIHTSSTFRLNSVRWRSLPDEEIPYKEQTQPC